MYEIFIVKAIYSIYRVYVEREREREQELEQEGEREREREQELETPLITLNTK